MIYIVLLDRLAKYDICAESDTWSDPWGSGFKPSMIGEDTNEIAEVYAYNDNIIKKPEWHAARIRYIMNHSDVLNDPISIDCECSGMNILAIPVIIDGWHRLHARWELKLKTIQASFCGREDLIEYLVDNTDKAPF